MDRLVGSKQRAYKPVEMIGTIMRRVLTVVSDSSVTSHYLTALNEGINTKLKYAENKS